MDFDTILYILMMVAWLGFTVFKALRKDEAERTAMKNKKRPVVVETSENTDNDQPKRKASRTFTQQAPQNEYFSYETMSDRDFEQAFSNNIAENEHIAAASETPHSNLKLNMDEEEVFKGIVWSEILKRKY
jgi:hypothetical protein